MTQLLCFRVQIMMYKRTICLATLCCLLLFCSATLCCLLLFFPACFSAKTERVPKSLSTVRYTSTHNWIIQYGWDKTGALKYAAFTGAKKPERPKGIVSSWSTGEETLEEPNGNTAKLPTSDQLYESLDGKFRKSKGDVTTGEIEAFIESNPNSFTIDALLTFVERLREKKEQKD